MECFDNILEKSTVFILIVGFIISINDYFMKYNGDDDDDGDSDDNDGYDNFENGDFDDEYIIVDDD